MVRSLPRLWSWAPVSRSMSLRLALPAPKRARATRLSSRVSRSVTFSFNEEQIARAWAAFNAISSADGRPETSRSDPVARQADRGRGHQAGRPDATAAGPRRLPLGSRADAGDAGPLSGRGDLRGG